MPSPDTTPETTLPFATSLAPEIMDGRKTATVRIGDPRPLTPGDKVAAVTPAGNQFTPLEITRTANAIAVEALSLIETFGAEYSATTSDELLETLRTHYDQSINPSTPVQVLVFKRIDC
jgi:hypothetical protein